MSYRIVRKLAAAAALSFATAGLMLAPTGAFAFGGHGGGQGGGFGQSGHFGNGGHFNKGGHLGKGDFGGGDHFGHGPRWGGVAYVYGPRVVDYGYACVVNRFIDEDGDLVIRRRCN